MVMRGGKKMNIYDSTYLIFLLTPIIITFIGLNFLKIGVFGKDLI